MITDVLIFILVILIILIIQKTRRPRNFPTGPWNLPVVGYLPFLGRDPHITFSKLAKKYGDIFSVNLGHVRLIVMHDPDMIREAFKQDVFSGRADNPFFNVRGGRKRGIHSSDGPEFVEQRPFTFQVLKGFGFGKSLLESTIQEEIGKTLTRLKSLAGEPVDPLPHFTVAAVNSLLQITVGKKFNHNDAQVLDLIKRIRVHLGDPAVIGIFNFLPWLVKLSPRLTKYDAYMGMVNALHKFFQPLIDEHLETYDESNLRDYIDVYIREVKKTTDPNSSFFGEIGLQTLNINLQDLFGGGADTTSTAVAWSLLYLIHHPEIAVKCQEEIDSVVGRDRLPSLSDKQNLPYCEAVIDEVFRKASITPLANFHNAMHDTEFAGYTIPKNTVFIPNLWHVHHNPKYFEDPFEFRPERFLTPDGKFKRNPNLMPFGAGKRMCPAESLARISIFLFFTALLQTFNFKLPEGSPLPRTDADAAIIVHPRPFYVLFEARE